MAQWSSFLTRNPPLKTAFFSGIQTSAQSMSAVFDGWYNFDSQACITRAPLSVPLVFSQFSVLTRWVRVYTKSGFQRTFSLVWRKDAISNPRWYLLDFDSADLSGWYWKTPNIPFTYWHPRVRPGVYRVYNRFGTFDVNHVSSCLFAGADREKISDANSVGLPDK